MIKNKGNYSYRTILPRNNGINIIRTKIACKQKAYERIANLQYIKISFFLKYLKLKNVCINESKIDLLSYFIFITNKIEK